MDRIPICRLNMHGENHVVECLDRPYDFWYVIKTFGPTKDDFRIAILYLNAIRNGKKPKWLYRLESLTPDNGLWYSSDNKYVFGIGAVEGCKTKELPMGYDWRYHKDGKNWFSSCSNIEDLAHWYSLEDAKELIENGFVFTKYYAADYVEYENETCFLKETILSRCDIEFDELQGLWNRTKQ